MKEICIDARMAFHSGIGTYIRNILPALKSSGLSVRILTNLSFSKRWPALNSYDVIPLEAPIYSIQEQFKLPLCIPSCDLFWAPHYNVPLAPIKARKRLTTIHDVYHLAYGKELGWKKRIYAKALIGQAIQRSTKIITISNFSKKEILRLTSAPEEKISMVYLGVNQQEFMPVLDRKRIEEIKYKYHLPDHYIAFVGNFAAHKNLSRLLQAWSLVLHQHGQFKLVLVGGRGQTFKELRILKDHVLELGKVDQKDLPIIYQLAYGAILPSLYEGFGLPPLEAMAMHCPMIVSTAASLPEVCGDAALYINPYDVHDIAQKICTLIENRTLRHTLIEKGTQRVNEFSWEKTTQAHLEIIHQMIR